MPSRTSYSLDEVNSARFALAAQLTAYATLAGEISGDSTDDTARAALDDFEPLFFNNLVLVLDRYFVHRLRSGTGTDPLTEVDLIVDSLMHNNAVLRATGTVSYLPARSVVKLEVGDDIRLTAAEFDALASAFLTELEARFLANVD